MILNTHYVPQHLLLMSCVLRYIMAQNNILRKPELDAFLVTAFSPELQESIDHENQSYIIIIYLVT